MTQNDDAKICKSEFCNYSSKRKYNIIQHQNVKHNDIIVKNIKKKNKEENVTPKEENVTPKEENVTPKEENVTPVCENVSPKFICKKCNKIYKRKINIYQIILKVYLKY